jgi:zinc transport system permease protein
MDDPAPTLREFFEAWELFRDPVLCGIFAGAVLGLQGVFIVLRRMVFVTAAVSQSAALGVALSFYAAIHLGWEVPPVTGALLLAVGVAMIFAVRPDRLRLPREGLLGLAYALAGGLTVLVGDRISQEAHDISAILFGTAVLVRPIDLGLVAGVGALVLAVHAFFHRGFVLAGFDADGARVQGVPVLALDVVLWTLVALEVSVATRALGALPVFAFAVLPALAALPLARRMGTALALAAALGAISGGLGYLAAFLLSFPVGASQTAVAALLTVAVVPLGRPRSA